MDKDTYNQLQDNLSLAAEDLMYLQGKLKNLDPDPAALNGAVHELARALETAIQVLIELLYAQKTVSV